MIPPPTQDPLDTIVIDYLFGELPAVEQAAFESVLKDDPVLAAEVHDHMALRTRWASVEEVAVPRPIIQRIMQEAENALKKPSFFERLAAFLMQPAMANNLSAQLAGCALSCALLSGWVTPPCCALALFGPAGTVASLGIAVRTHPLVLYY